MNQKEEIPRLKGLAILTVFLLVVAGFLGGTLLFFNKGDFFSETITQVDASLSQGNLEKAQQDLYRASKYANTRLKWFSTLKRAYLLSERENDYTCFADFVKLSRKFTKANSELNAFYTASLIWTKQYRKAGKSIQYLNSPGYETLIAEVLLNNEILNTYSPPAEPIDFVKEKLLFQDDPGFFDLIGTLTQRDSILYNSALLYFKQGSRANVKDVLKRLEGSTTISPYQLGILYYDLKEYDKALESFIAQSVLDEQKSNQRYNIEAQIGDLLLMQNDLDKAFKHYKKAISLSQTKSEKSFVNLAKINYKKGYLLRAKKSLEEGLLVFPQSELILNCYVDLLYDTFPFEVEDRLNHFIERNPDLVDPLFFKLKYYPRKMNSKQYESALWTLFNRDLSNEAVAKALLWYLSGQDDLKSMEILLSRFNWSDHKPHWYYFYEAYLSLIKKNYPKAVKQFEAGETLSRSWLYPYNIGILYECMGEYREAEKSYKKSLDQIQLDFSLEQASYYNSLLYSHLAWIYYKEKNFLKAEESLKNALKTNPENQRANLLFNQMKM